MTPRLSLILHTRRYESGGDSRCSACGQKIPVGEVLVEITYASVWQNSEGNWFNVVRTFCEKCEPTQVTHHG